MARKVKTREQAVHWFITDEDRVFGVSDLKGGCNARHLNAVFVRQCGPSAKRECPNVNVDVDTSGWCYDDEPPWIRPDGRYELSGIAGLSNCISDFGYEFA